MDCLRRGVGCSLIVTLASFDRCERGGDNALLRLSVLGLLAALRAYMLWYDCLNEGVLV